MNWHAAVQAATSGVLPSSTYASGTVDANGGYGIGATLTATANAALAIDAPLTDAERRARSLLTTKQVTLR